jgi:hypothetical protein
MDRQNIAMPIVKQTYSNVEIKMLPNGRKTVRRVYVKNGKGYKSVTKYRKGKRVSSVKKPIHLEHCERIQNGIFVPQLFADLSKKST